MGDRSRAPARSKHSAASRCTARCCGPCAARGLAERGAAHFGRKGNRAAVGIPDDPAAASVGLRRPDRPPRYEIGRRQMLPATTRPAPRHDVPRRAARVVRRRRDVVDAAHRVARRREVDHGRIARRSGRKLRRAAEVLGKQRSGHRERVPGARAARAGALLQELERLRIILAIRCAWFGNSMGILPFAFRGDVAAARKNKNSASSPTV
eukprot:4333582-Prymnesium_polylepis.1